MFVLLIHRAEYECVCVTINDIITNIKIAIAMKGKEESYKCFLTKKPIAYNFLFPFLLPRAIYFFSLRSHILPRMQCRVDNTEEFVWISA